MANERKKITMIDIAREANVSQSTVSRVINQQPGINEAKYRKVMEAMKRLGYAPPQSAGSPRKTICLVICPLPEQKDEKGRDKDGSRRRPHLIRRHSGQAAHGPKLNGGQLSLRVSHSLQHHQPGIRRRGDDDPRQDIGPRPLQPGPAHQGQDQDQRGHSHQEGASHDLGGGSGPQHNSAGRSQGSP